MHGLEMRANVAQPGGGRLEGTASRFRGRRFSEAFGVANNYSGEGKETRKEHGRESRV